jgi:hypothetical protein
MLPYLLHQTHEATALTSTPRTAKFSVTPYSKFTPVQLFQKLNFHTPYITVGPHFLVWLSLLRYLNFPVFYALMSKIGRFHPFYRPQRPLERVGKQRYFVFRPPHQKGWGVSITPWSLSTFVKDPIPIYRRLVKPHDKSGQVRKISPPPGFDPQPVASRYTDWAIRPTSCRK